MLYGLHIALPFNVLLCILFPSKKPYLYPTSENIDQTTWLYFLSWHIYSMQKIIKKISLIFWKPFLVPTLEIRQVNRHLVLFPWIDTVLNTKLIDFSIHNNTGSPFKDSSSIFPTTHAHIYYIKTNSIVHYLQALQVLKLQSNNHRICSNSFIFNRSAHQL